MISGITGNMSTEIKLHMNHLCNIMKQMSKSKSKSESKKDKVEKVGNLGNDKLNSNSNSNRDNTLELIYK